MGGNSFTFPCSFILKNPRLSRDRMLRMKNFRLINMVNEHGMEGDREE